MLENKDGALRHRITIALRDRTEIEGITEVESFDEAAVVLLTDCGELTLEGEGLHVGVLDISKGNVVVEGHITGLYYADGTMPRRGRKKRTLLS